MLFLDREYHLKFISECFRRVIDLTEGHAVFISGEAGIGKTSLAKAFLRTVDKQCTILKGACDSLFAPSAMLPLYDIARQLGYEFISALKQERDRSLVFASLIHQISRIDGLVVLLIEDIHWADEASLDFIRYLVRRIESLNCLFLITYRDDDIDSLPRLRNLFSVLPVNNYSQLHVDRFSKETVMQLAVQRGYADGNSLYNLTGGNPFYISEIVNSPGKTITTRVIDSILTAVNKRGETEKKMLELLSVLPSRIDTSIAKMLEIKYPEAMHLCIASGIIVSNPKSTYLEFKHELYRVTVERSLTPSARKEFHREILALILSMLDRGQKFFNLSQIVHHARHCNENDLVLEFAPKAACAAAFLGSHWEAAELFQVAIDYCDDKSSKLATLYEQHAYECYLTYQFDRAIDSSQKALSIWQASEAKLRVGDVKRFLSRLWWFKGDGINAIEFGRQAISELDGEPSSREKALAFSHMSQLHMLKDNAPMALYWGRLALDLADKLNDKEILAHALNNVGTVLLKIPEQEKEGEEKLRSSLTISLNEGLHEHVARAYVNLTYTFSIIKRINDAAMLCEMGLRYCEERDLDTWKFYLENCKARILMEKGDWSDADKLAQSLESNLQHSIVIIDALVVRARVAGRRGDFITAQRLIAKAEAISKGTHEPQRVIPVIIAALELSWLTDTKLSIDIRLLLEKMITDWSSINYWYAKELKYWMDKCQVTPPEMGEVALSGQDYRDHWMRLGSEYEYAIELSEGPLKDRRTGFRILDQLEAVATMAAIRFRLKVKGICRIPRGARKSTRSNSLHLTSRELDVLRLLGDGARNKDIAAKLFIAPKTVDNHVTGILSKFNVSSRTKAVSIARTLGLLGQ